MSCCSCLPTPQSILDDEEIDVFESIIADSEYKYTEKRAILWSTYRFRSIGCGNIAYWLQTMKDRYARIFHEYDIKIKAWDTFNTNISGGIDFSDSSSEFDQENKREDVPDNATSGTEYLSERTKTHYEGKNYGGLASTTARDYIDGVPRDPFEDFADEFKRLFYHGL